MMVTANGSHGLSCGLGPGRIARHATMNDIIMYIGNLLNSGGRMGA